MALGPGRRLGAYEILSVLGAGGMGEVYRARDTRLNRDVALKVLPGSVANDPGRLARFRREAQVLAALNHPNIAHIHGLEDAGDTPALVMELVNGPTLADLLLAKGPRPKAQETGGARFGPRPLALSLSEVVAITRQIVDALEAAHAQHIVHRDLKPANVKVRDDGIVKVLDFGIAKVLESAASDDSGATMTAIDTQVGIVIGTPAYMSPEQARGAPVDERTDIWSFGCVLYEMIGGRRPFPGESSAQVVAAVLEREPDWAAVAQAPPPIRRLLRRCLQKDPRRRLRDIGDARFDLEELQTEAGEVTPTVLERGRRPSIWLGTGLAAGLLTAAALWFAFGRSEPGRNDGRTNLDFQSVTDAVGVEQSPAISPDGKTVAFVAYTGRRRQIWIRRLEGGVSQVTNADLDHEQPRWAPNSNTLMYFTRPLGNEPQGRLWEIPMVGGQARPLASTLGGGDISHTGDRIAAFQLINDRPALVILGRDGLFQREVATTRRRAGKTPRWSPDDRSIAYFDSPPGIFNSTLLVVPASGGAGSQLDGGGIMKGLSWIPDGSGVVYASSAGSTVPYPPVFHLRLKRLSFPDSEQLTFGEDSYTDPDVHGASGLLFATRTEARSALWRVPTTGTPGANAQAATSITNQTSQVQTPSASPDGKEIVYLSDSGGHGNLWVTDARGQSRRQITFVTDPGTQVGLPLWSPDGTQIAYIRNNVLENGQWLVKPDGSDHRQLLAGGFYAAWSPDGDWLYYAVNADPGGPCVEKVLVRDRAAPPMRIRCESAVAPVPRADGTLYFQARHLAPDGGYRHHLHKAKPEGGTAMPLLRVEDSQMPPDSGFAISLAFSPDGRWIAYVVMDGATANLWKIPAGGGEPQQITDFGDRARLILRQISWPDNGFLYAAIADVDADIVSLAGLVRAVGK